MKVIELVIETERDRIKGVPLRWRYQYGTIRSYPGENLDHDICTAADIAQAIGNNSWTRFTCGLCCKDYYNTSYALNFPVRHENGFEETALTCCLSCINELKGLLNSIEQLCPSPKA